MSADGLERLATFSGQKLTSDQLRRFFNWTPDKLEKAKIHTRSTSTRQPKFFDSHLHEKLRLKRVVVVGDLPRIISDVCDPYIEPAVLSTLPSPADGFPGPDNIEFEPIMDEKDLLVAYKWDNEYGLSWFPTEPSNLDAIPDGFLTFEHPNMLTPNHQHDVELLVKHSIQHLAIWEFKNLNFDHEKMSGITQLEGDFEWTVCDESRKNWDCETTKHLDGMTGLVAITGRQRTSFDLPPEKHILSDQLLDNRSVLDLEKRRSEVADNSLEPSKTQSVHDIIQQTWASAVKFDVTFLVISSGNYEYLGVRHRQTQTLYISPLIDLSSLKRGELGVGYAKLHVGLYIATYFDAVERAKLMEDCLKNGNLPPAFNLCVQKDKNIYPELPQGLDHDVTGLHQQEEQNEPSRETYMARKRKEVSSDDDPAEEQECCDLERNESQYEKGNASEVDILAALQHANIVAVHFPARLVSRNPDIPRIFNRLGSMPSSLILDPDLEKLDPKTLNLVVHHPLTQNVFVTTVRTYDQKSSSRVKLVMKIAQMDTGQDRMLKEEDGYKILSKFVPHNIPKIYGFFEGVMNNKQPAGSSITPLKWIIFVMSYVGKPVTVRKYVKNGSKRLKLDNKIKTILSTLERESIAHLQIRGQHFLVDRKDDVYIISPSTLKRPASQKEIDRDKADTDMNLDIDL